MPNFKVLAAFAALIVFAGAADDTPPSPSVPVPTIPLEPIPPRPPSGPAIPFIVAAADDPLAGTAPRTYPAVRSAGTATA